MKLKATMTGDEIIALIESMFTYNGMAMPDKIVFFDADGTEIFLGGARMGIESPQMMVRSQPEPKTEPLTADEIVRRYSSVGVGSSGDPQ